MIKFSQLEFSVAGDFLGIHEDFSYWLLCCEHSCRHVAWLEGSMWGMQEMLFVRKIWTQNDVHQILYPYNWQNNAKR